MKRKNLILYLSLGIITFLFPIGCGKDYHSWKELKNCPGIPSFEYEGQVYNTVQIGDQCWMAENLNVGVKISGNEEMTNNGKIEKYCYDNDPANCEIYGGLYQWDEIMNHDTTFWSGSICPNGWHIPSQNDWMKLADFLDNDGASKLKKCESSWKTYSNYKSNNSSGFSALPSGYCNNYGTFYGQGENTAFWGKEKSFASQIKYDKGDVSYQDFSDKEGFSVRCIRTNRPPILRFHTGNNSDNFPIDGSLIWGGFDPEQNIITYNVYFGEANTSGSLQLVAQNIHDTVYTPETLNYATIYNWKIMAHDGKDTTWSDILTFRTNSAPCPGIPEVFYQGISYHTVKVGSQCWLRENLNVGDMIPLGNTSTNKNVIEKYCIDDDPANCDIYGGLYKWDVMMQYSIIPESQGICPLGWHIPSNDDWDILFNYLGDNTGGKMKEIGTVHWKSPNEYATNESGLSFLPGALDNYFYSQYSELNELSSFWSSNIDGLGGMMPDIHFYVLFYDKGTVSHSTGWIIQFWAHSVRCIKDTDE